RATSDGSGSGGAGGRRAPQICIFCVLTKRETTVSWRGRVAERNATQRGLERPPPPSSAADDFTSRRCGGKLVEGAVPCFEEAVVVLAGADGDTKGGGGPHRGAVPHQDARLQERDPGLVCVLAYARKHGVGL